MARKYFGVLSVKRIASSHKTGLSLVNAKPAQAQSTGHVKISFLGTGSTGVLLALLIFPKPVARTGYMGGDPSY